MTKWKDEPAHADLFLVCPLCKQRCNKYACDCTNACLDGRNIRTLKFIAGLCILAEVVIGFTAVGRPGIIWFVLPVVVILAWAIYKLQQAEDHIKKTFWDYEP